MKHSKLLLIIILIIGCALYSFTKKTQLGLDLQGGIHLVLEAQPSDTIPLTQDRVLGTIEVIRNRIDALGLSEPSIRMKGTNQIVVELPGIKNPDDAKALIGKTALLTFIQAEWAPTGIENLNKKEQALLLGSDGVLDYVITKDYNGDIISKRPIILKSIGLTGEDLQKATPGTDEFGKPLVSLTFSKKGGKKFYNLTASNIGKPIAISLDNTIISAPTVQTAIGGGKAQISGSFTPREVNNLVIQLNAGALPIPISIVSEKQIGPSLGKASIYQSKIAFIIGLVCVFMYMIIIYKRPGILSILSLLCYCILALSTFKLVDATLTLPGIAGFILTIGMAVDANVIIFERIKEDLNPQLSLAEHITKGFKRAYITILDANITTLLAACVLFWVGTGTIKGFAVTLSIGILMSMFSAITITQTLLLSFPKLSQFDGKKAL